MIFGMPILGLALALIVAYYVYQWAKRKGKPAPLVWGFFGLFIPTVIVFVALYIWVKVRTARGIGSGG